MPYLVVLGQTVQAYGYPPENWPVASRLSKSLEVIGTDTGWLGAYDFLLVILVNSGRSMSYRFQDKRHFGRKFSHASLAHLMPPAEGFLLEFGNCDGAEKRKGMGGEKFDDMFKIHTNRNKIQGNIRK